MQLEILNHIYDFLDGVFSALTSLIIWIGDLAVLINDINLEHSGLANILGLYRYLVGDTIYLANITSLYIGLLFIAIRTIPIFVGWWKAFSPFHSK